MFVNEVKKYVKKVLQSSPDLAIMLWGPPGVGKTSVAKEAADELGWDYLCLQVSVYNPIDLAGLPCPDREAGVAKYLPPSFIKAAIDADKPMVLCFDEIASAPPAVQVATQRVILERKFGEFELSPHVRIVATGNRASDRAATFNMPTPLANRFLHVLDIGCSVEDWKLWALKNNQHPLVISYLSFAPDSLMAFPKDPEVRAYPTPRSWSFVSKLMQSFQPQDDEFFQAVSTAIGEPAAANFLAFAKTYTELPDIEAILDGTNKASVDQNRADLLYAICGALIGGLQRKVTADRIDNFLDYVSDKLPAEFTLLAARDAFGSGLDAQLIRSKNWSKFSKMNISWIM